MFVLMSLLITIVIIVVLILAFNSYLSSLLRLFLFPINLNKKLYNI